MIKIDLVTGFLGSGKTTFIKKYVRYFIDKGQKIGILENDYGAINIDLMLLGDLIGDNCEIEMIIGGGDPETHKRRFRTKLIAMAMSGYDRVIVEPSGIFEPEEFFDLLHEEPLDSWYEAGSVITIVDVSFETDMSESSRYLLATQLASAGAIIFSRQENFKYKDVEGTITYLNSMLEEIKCKRRIKPEDIAPSTGRFGKVIRIKGFIKEVDKYYFINMTKNNIELNRIDKGQDILIVIGEGLDEKNIKEELDV